MLFRSLIGSEARASKLSRPTSLLKKPSAAVPRISYLADLADLAECSDQVEWMGMEDQLPTVN